MEKILRALSLGVVVGALSLAGCNLMGGSDEAPEGSGASADLSAQFKPGGCCDTAYQAGEECSHPCCQEALAAGEVCEKCNPPRG